MNIENTFHFNHQAYLLENQAFSLLLTRLNKPPPLSIPDLEPFSANLISSLPIIPKRNIRLTLETAFPHVRKQRRAEPSYPWLARASVVIVKIVEGGRELAARAGFVRVECVGGAELPVGDGGFDAVDAHCCLGEGGEKGEGEEDGCGEDHGGGGWGRSFCGGDMMV
ncbi:hypothetical protein BT63DRAFT_227521 [Microthyrium microscopicum]|uniref:Uncharacterized protein n=1 Tax=Microthyrium microscopicum TaxID=703497 RepID=A0A6A6UCJ8_9PEZI|nr:hypothetical protein BT63DRAFT_227521 [Microthyrium microscopicum]